MLLPTCRNFNEGCEKAIPHNREYQAQPSSFLAAKAGASIKSAAVSTAKPKAVVLMCRLSYRVRAIQTANRFEIIASSTKS
jgi:hypothetical protein